MQALIDRLGVRLEPLAAGYEAMRELEEFVGHSGERDQVDAGLAARFAPRGAA